MDPWELNREYNYQKEKDPGERSSELKYYLENTQNITSAISSLFGLTETDKIYSTVQNINHNPAKLLYFTSKIGLMHPSPILNHSKCACILVLYLSPVIQHQLCHNIAALIV